MRPLFVRVGLFGLLLCLAALPATAFKGSRAYVEKQREIARAKKQLVVERQDVEEFEKLLESLDALRLPDEMEWFWHLNEGLRKAMEHEYAEITMRVVSGQGVAEGAPDASQPRTMKAESATPPVAQPEAEAGPAPSSLEDRAARMDRIIVESQGLERALSNGDTDVMPRYRHLLGEFSSVMREDIEATAKELKEQERALRRM